MLLKELLECALKWGDYNKNEMRWWIEDMQKQNKMIRMIVKMQLTNNRQASLHLRKRWSQLCKYCGGATKPETDLNLPTNHCIHQNKVYNW